MCLNYPLERTATNALLHCWDMLCVTEGHPPVFGAGKEFASEA